MSAVYTIPSGGPFLSALARGLLARHPAADDPFALSRVTVYLPTRRAVRSLEEAFLEALGTHAHAALLLPRLKALGEADEEALALGGNEDDGPAEIAPAISESQRLMRLAELLQRRVPGFENALVWAQSLARFLDEVEIEEADLSALGAELPQDLAQHFESSREFLKIVSEHWPAILVEDGVIESASRRRLLMEAELRAWAQKPPGAVYVAGSTGSVPVTQRLMQAVLALPSGVIVLPGFDPALDDEAWTKLDDTHPQAGMKALLGKLAIDRANVEVWPYTEGSAAGAARRRLLAEVLRPAPTTDSWAQALSGISLAEGLAGLSLHVARDRPEEARAIALAMRETLERPGASAALVTPDRKLARRVASELARWGIAVDDSAGAPLLESAPARFLRLMIEAVATGFAPIPLLGLLKHPVFSVWGDAWRQRRAVSALERHALRGARPAPGLASLKSKLAEEPDEERAKRSAEARALAIELVDALANALRPMTDAADESQSPAEWVAVLAAAVETISRDLWLGPAGDSVSALLEEIAVAKGSALSLGEFVCLLEQSGGGRALRPRMRAHPRLAIWGLLEARLQSADLIILGALNEGVWPAIADAGPWASRAMRKAMGLSSPERWVGLAAHDFEALAASPRVLLTAAEKVEGSPVRRSRFVMRLENFLAGRKQTAEAAPYGVWAKELSRPLEYRPVKAPQPRPELRLRPREFAITDIAKLRRDPYSIFAKRVLNLRPLDPIDADTVARDRGNLFHGILEDFVRAHPDALPPLALEAFNRIADARVAAQGLEPDVEKLLRARLARVAGRFLEWEAGHRARARNLGVEVKGEIKLAMPAGEITLKGRVDRIDVDRESGAAMVFDYKTGRTPSKRQVEVMLEPQLALGAMLLLREGLGELRAPSVDRLAYLHVGGNSSAIEKLSLNEGVAALIDATERGLLTLLANYDDADKSYLSWPIRERERDKGDYDLLARVAEWQAAEADEE